MQIILLFTTLASIIFLTIYGAGMYSWSLLLATTALAGTTCLTWFLRTRGCKLEGEDQAAAKGGSALSIIHIAIIVFILLTLLPLPKSLTIVTGRERYKQNIATTELLEKAESLEVCQPSLRLFSITRNRAGTMRVLLLVVAMYSLFEAVRLLSPRNRIIYLHILISIGVIVAIAGYLSYAVYPQGNKLWWMFSVPPFFRPPVGCFLNANHYAGFIAMLSIAALGITVINIRTKHWILAVFTITAAVIMAFFVMISASRGAMLALSAGLFSLVAAFVVHLNGRMRIISVSVVIIVIGIGTIFAFQNDKIRSRISTLRHPYSDSGVRPRLAAWGGALRLWTHYPVMGVGANAFRVTYPQHKNSQFRAYRRFAENEFLHILAEGGLVGIILLGLLILSIITALRQSLHSPPLENSLAICAVAVLIAGAAHASVDFILHLPLYAITVASIIAAGTKAPPNNKSHRNAIVLTLIICLGLIPLTRPMTEYDTGGYIVSASNDKLATLMTWSPTNSQVLRKFGANIAQRNMPETDVLSEVFLERAAEYDPNDFNIWIKLGKLRLKRNNTSGAKEAFKKATAIRSWAPVPKID